MVACPDNESWINDAVAEVIRKKRRAGRSLSEAERLIYCLWVADYGIRNAGDFGAARMLHHDFQQEAAILAKQLGLRFTCESFSLPATILEKEYCERFDRICDRNA